ncbi:hypothetical protein K438DRAFT_1764072 [Mycena galopus ATCC 62051]|nr:hypothetical protein K438DRAFT_1764072 [Mycena galopus ATCC 62051]
MCEKSHCYTEEDVGSFESTQSMLHGDRSFESIQIWEVPGILITKEKPHTIPHLFGIDQEIQQGIKEKDFRTVNIPFGTRNNHNYSAHPPFPRIPLFLRPFLPIGCSMCSNIGRRISCGSYITVLASWPAALEASPVIIVNEKGNALDRISASRTSFECILPIVGGEKGTLEERISLHSKCFKSKTPTNKLEHVRRSKGPTGAPGTCGPF